MDLIRNDMTRAAMARHGWTADVAIADLLGESVMLVAGTLAGQSFSTYVGDELGGPFSAGRIEDMLFALEAEPDVENMTASTQIDAYIAHASTLPGIEHLHVSPYVDANSPTLDMIAPGIGRVSLVVSEKPLEKHLAKLKRERRQDAEGRTLTRFGAMSLALVARDAEDLDRILDTAFVADDLTYRGIHMRITHGTQVQPTVRSGTMLVLPDGIEVIDLPETIKLALRGGEMDGQPLARVADMPGFEGLRIGTINRQTSVNRLTAGGGGGWIKIHVRDEHNARMEDLEIEEARTVAHDTLDRRHAIIGVEA